MILTRAQNETEMMVDGPQGKLELIYGEPTSPSRHDVAIVCHPHPLYGGTMHNKVVTTVTKTFQGIGLYTVRFNFRGVGKSEGVYGEGVGELEDFIAVMNWVKKEKPAANIWLAGFSFGAYIALKAAMQFPFKVLVTVAPPVLHFPLEKIEGISSAWILIQGEKDEVVSAQSVFEWADKQNPKPIILKFPEATHFFHGQLTPLRTELERVLKNIIM